MEYAVFNINTNARLKDSFSALEIILKESRATRKKGRIYLGSEYCFRLIPTIGELAKAMKKIQGRGFALTLVTPAMLNDQESESLRRILAYLNKFGSKVEVVINDWGVLELSQEYSNLSLIWGRLLNKRERDPRVDYDKLSFGARQVLQSSLLDNDRISNYLEAKRITKIEFDNTIQGIRYKKNKRKFQIHLYYPFVAVSLSRVCLFSSTALPENKKFRNQGCRRQCLEYLVKRSLRGRGVAEDVIVWQIGKGIYFENGGVPSDLEDFKRCVLTIL